MGSLINVVDGYDDGMVDNNNFNNMKNVSYNNYVHKNNFNDSDGYDDGNDNNKIKNISQNAFESIREIQQPAMTHSLSSDKFDLSNMNEVTSKRKETANKLRRSKKMEYMARRQRSSHNVRLPFIKSISTEHLNNALLEVLGEKTFSNAITVIQSISPEIIRQNRESKRTYVDTSLGAGKQIIIKPSGKVYLCIGNLGKGSYKSTEKGLYFGKIANFLDPNLSLGVQEPKFRAISLPIEGKIDQTSQDELALNLHLREMKRDNNNLSNVNVVRSVSLINAAEKVVVTELCDGDINKLIMSKNLNESKKHFIAKEMSIGLKQLHDLDIVHRDCKPDNFLYKLNTENEIDKVLITDFGFSKPVNEPDKNRNMFLPISDPTWPAQAYSKESDIYQMGIAFIHLYAGYSVEEWKTIVLTGKENLPGVDPTNTPSQKIRLWKQQVPSEWMDFKGEKVFDKINDPEVKEFVIKMISLDRAERPTIEQVISFFEGKL